MATQYTFGKIVTDGLVLCLDAADRNSYVSGSTTWNSVVGSTTGSLVNGPTFNTGSGGSIVFDGVDDYVRLYPVNSTSSLSIDFFFRTTSTGVKLMTGMYNGGGPDWWIGLSNNKANWSFGSPAKADITSSIAVNDGNIRHLSCTYDKSINSIFMYLNGVLQSSANTIPSTVEQPGGNAAIGTFGDLGSYYLLGNIYNYKIYNRALSASEVAQNYSAQKSRFGL